MRPAMAFTVPVESGVLNSHCCWEARLYSVARSPAVKFPDW